MTFLNCKCVFREEEYGKDKEEIDNLSLNIDGIESFNPANEQGHTTVNMKSGLRFEIICGYSQFLDLVAKYSDIPIISINCN